jgi:DNA-binding beta-propeller fold protein YncE
MNVRQARVRLVWAGTALAVAALVAGCGSEYRPVITPINPSGPAAQPSSYAAVVSAPSTTTAGIATVIDYSGDTILATAPIGIGPLTFSLDQLGSTGYTINSDHTLTNFPVSNTLQAKYVNDTTLDPNAVPVNLFAPTSNLWAADLENNVVDVFTGSPQTFLRSIPVAATPVAVVGPGSSGQRYFTISQNFANSTGVECNTAPQSQTQVGVVDTLEVASYTVSGIIPVGVCPVGAVSSTDKNRLFVLNRGSDTITVINSANDTLDQCAPFLNQNGQQVTCHPTLPLSTSAIAATGITPTGCTLSTDPTCGGMTQTAGPVQAEYNAATSQLIVTNYDGGTVSIIDVSLDQYGNDSATFGTTYTVPVAQTAGVAPYPASVTVLNDGSRAYTANQGDGTVAIVNLTSHTVEKWLNVVGNPRTVVSTQNSLYGKVYVASPNSDFVTIISTTTDLVDTTVLVEGNVVDVRVSTQTAVSGSGNTNNVSRRPGYGLPCNLPPNLEPTPTGAQTKLDVCRQQP